MICTKPIVAPVSDCTPSMGGITKVKITVLNAPATPATGEVYEYVYDCTPETSHYESVLETNMQNLTSVVTTTVFIDFGKNVGTTATAINSLIMNHVKLRLYLANGQSVEIGTITNPAWVSGGNAVSGTAANDRAGADLTFTQKQASFPEPSAPVAVTYTTGTVKLGSSSGSVVASGSLVEVGSTLYISNTTGETATVTWGDATTSTVALDSNHSGTFTLLKAVTGIAYA